jgi:hypothetical protein
MSWPAGQQRVLDRIEETLLADDQHLGSLFAFFTMLAGDDAMPGTERVRVTRRLPRPALLAAAGLIAVTVSLLTLLAPGRPACSAAAVTPSVLSSSADRPSAHRQAAGCRPASRASTKTSSAGKIRRGRSRSPAGAAALRSPPRDRPAAGTVLAPAAARLGREVARTRLSAVLLPG